jgi:hypothetical protein
MPEGVRTDVMERLRPALTDRLSALDREHADITERTARLQRWVRATDRTSVRSVC